MFSLIALGIASGIYFQFDCLNFPKYFTARIVARRLKRRCILKAVCVILTLVIMGQWMEAKAHQRTGKAIEELMNLSPDTANLVVNGTEKKVALF